MARFVKADVIVLPFPFSDLTDQKKRPALVIQPVAHDDLILCQITSRFKQDGYSIKLDAEDFAEGSLPLQSYVRPNRLFTADENIILYKIGRLKAEKFSQIVEMLVRILRE